MRKREFVFAAMAAALLSVGSAKTASAMASANCYDTCDAAFGTYFHEDDYWFDDVGQLGEPGWWGLAGCEESGGTTYCYYSHTGVQ